MVKVSVRKQGSRPVVLCAAKLPAYSPRCSLDPRGIKGNPIVSTPRPPKVRLKFPPSTAKQRQQGQIEAKRSGKPLFILPVNHTRPIPQPSGWEDLNDMHGKSSQVPVARAPLSHYGHQAPFHAYQAYHILFPRRARRAINVSPSSVARFMLASSIEGPALLRGSDG